jgi:hypothetical protein
MGAFLLVLLTTTMKKKKESVKVGAKQELEWKSKKKRGEEDKTLLGGCSNYGTFPYGRPMS